MSTNGNDLWSDLGTGLDLSAPNQWYGTANTYKGMITYSPAKTSSTVPHTYSIKICQPKYQANGYYKYNFRLNKGDTVQMWGNPNRSTATATWTAGAATVLANGAVALGVSAVLAVGASLSF